MTSLSGRTALVTGSTSGIGRGIAEAFAAGGASVVVTGRNVERGTEVVSAITAAGGTARFVPGDVNSEDEVHRVVEETVAAFGGCDVLVNNAAPTGVGADDEVINLRTEDLELTFRVGLFAPFWFCKHAVPHMLERSRGSIINISSTASIRGFRRRPAYSASKAGLEALTRVLAADYGQRGVRANAIVVGWVRSSPLAKKVLDDPQVDEAVRRLLLTPDVGEVEDIAEVALFLASDASRYVNGASVTADGGITTWMDFGRRNLGSRAREES